MSDAVSRNRKRDREWLVERLQKRVAETRRRLDLWLDSTPGQLVLIGVAAVGVLLVSLITP